MTARKWSFENISPDLIELDLENCRLTFDHDNIEIDTKVFSFGKRNQENWRRAIKKTQINFRIQWREFGAPGRRGEKYWIIIEVDEKTPPPPSSPPKYTSKRRRTTRRKTKAEDDVEMNQSEKDALHERFESILINPTASFMLHKSESDYEKKVRKWMKGGGSDWQKKQKVGRLFTPSLLEKLKIKSYHNISGFLSWPLTTLAEMFQITLSYPKNTLYSLAEIFLAWAESIDKRPPGEQSFQGVITNEFLNMYFGVSPGFPQFMISGSNDTEIDGALVVGLSLRFDSYTYDDNGLLSPNHIFSKHPSLPKREENVPIPLVITYMKQVQKMEEQVRRVIMDEKGEIDGQKLPVSLVGLRTDAWPSEKKFIEAMETISKKLGFKIVFDIRRNKKNPEWPNTYKYILSWCLAYVDEGPPSGIEPEKGAAYARSFPIYIPPKKKLSNKKFAFCWFQSARGLVHDLALGYFLDDWKKEQSNRWLLLGDETGIGRELIKSKKTIKQPGKKFSYIWVLIPPGIFPMQIASDFHAMDQGYFGREHIQVLTDLIETPEPRLITFVFETDDYLDVDEKMSVGNISPSATVLKATLPLVFEYISHHTTKSDNSEYVISTISEQWSWMEAGTKSPFLDMVGLDYFDHVNARGRGKFKIEDHEIKGKLDHPWLPYADAMGFMTNDSLPKSLENIKKKLNDSIKFLPIHLSFLNNEFPKLAQLLSSKPISFIERLCEVDSKDVYAYMDDILSGMIHDACDRFSPIDWISVNKLMVEKQRHLTPRIIANQVTNWALPKLPELLNQLPTDLARLNMCLTLGWSTEQQGGNISPIIEQISPDWLNSETCPESYRVRLVKLIFADRQNFFDFNTDSKLLSESGMRDYPSLTPLDMENILQDKKTLTEENAKTLGIFFSVFALHGLKDDSLREALWKSNELFVRFEWKKLQDHRRHCIYGGEFAIDCAQHDASWYEKAYQRLFVDIKNYCGTGEDEQSETYWWPAALKYHSLRSDSESHTLGKDECELLIKKARKIARKSPLNVKIRLFYWMARLSETYGIPGRDKHFQDLKLLVQEEEIANHDVYTAIFYVHLIDLWGRYNAHELELQSEKLPSKYYKKNGSLDMRYTKCRKFAAKRAGSLKPVDFRRDFSSALENCSETTRLHFSDFLENPDTCITDCLKFNYL